jgi:type VI secretion system secreted protein Hcp
MKNWIKNGVVSAVVASSLVVTQPAFAAVSMVVKIGDIVGESTVQNHAGEIDVLEYSWGVAQPNAKVGPQRAAGGTVNALTLTKYVDAASPRLFLDSARGRVMPTAQFTVMKAGGKVAIEVIKIKLENVMVASVTTGHAATGDRFTETITLVFSGAEYTYTGVRADQSATAPITVKWQSEAKM